MPNLKCHEYSCKHNNCTHCKLQTLSITQNAICADYEKRMFNKKEDCEYEFGLEKEVSLKQDEQRILCSALACMNNTSGECSASYIRVDTKGENPTCCQVRKK